MGFDPDALASLGGGPRPAKSPAKASFLLRVGAAAGLGAAVCDLGVWLLAQGFDWSLQAGDQQVAALSVVIVCLLVGTLAGLGAYVAVRVTRKPAVWTAVVGLLLLAASITGLPPALIVMHLVAGAWIIGWLTAAVRGGTHVR